ncbi:MAG: STAS/SEC14 domain-containing protein [Rhodocyclaceae bacterium]|nr:STAS/SEC14 domain-containing protein [Rhodocyclaceae bacterium]
MIAIDHKGTLVTVTVLGEFTLADYTEFEALVNYKVDFEGPVDLYLDLREMLSFTVDVLWEDIKFSREHANDFRRIAIVTESQWITWSAWLNKVFLDTELQVFEDADEARAWVESV